MGVFEEAPMLTIFLLLVAAFLIVYAIISRSGGTRGVVCPKCGTAPPPRAKFCNRCGQKL